MTQERAFTGSPDAGRLIGMSVVFAGLDLEQAVAELARLGFEAVEVFVGHLGPRVVDAPVMEAHAVAAGAMVRGAGLEVSTLNCIVGELDPFSSELSLERTAQSLARHLRLAAAMGSPRVLIWDGEIEDAGLLGRAPARLARAVERGRALSGLEDLPQVAVELHPNTFAFRYGIHEEVADALRGAGAGICLDFCHAAVSLGREFFADLSPSFLGSVSHVHFADSDCTSEQLHFPPGEGAVDIDGAQEALAQREIGVAWDLFGWPAPRAAVAAGMSRYRRAVDRIGGSPGRPQTVRGR